MEHLVLDLLDELGVCVGVISPYIARFTLLDMTLPSVTIVAFRLVRAMYACFIVALGYGSLLDFVHFTMYDCHRSGMRPQLEVRFPLS